MDTFNKIKHFQQQISYSIYFEHYKEFLDTFSAGQDGRPADKPVKPTKHLLGD